MEKTIILYFSKTGTTEKVAEVIASKLGADVYQLVEAVPYTNADLNWNNPTSRANIEQGDESARPAYKGELPDLTSSHYCSSNLVGMAATYYSDSNGKSEFSWQTGCNFYNFWWLYL